MNVPPITLNQWWIVNGKIMLLRKLIGSAYAMDESTTVTATIPSASHKPGFSGGFFCSMIIIISCYPRLIKSDIIPRFLTSIIGQVIL